MECETAKEVEEWNGIDERCLEYTRTEVTRSRLWHSSPFVHGRVYERTYLRWVYAIIEYRDFDARRKMKMDE